jgi:tRNA(fMet)-specific endonuclease VapC
LAYLLDTNIAIHLRDGDAAVLKKAGEQRGALLLSALSLAELQRGICKAAALTAVRQLRLEIMLRYLIVIPFDAAGAEAYGRIIAACGWAKGKDFDRMIAAHAIATRSTLVTNNLADFRGIPRLLLENWKTASP